MIVFTLLVVLLAESGAASYTRDFATQSACEHAAAAAHEAAQTAIGVLDVGTLCVRSELSETFKPRA